MIIYKDIVSGDELFSDSYTIKLIDDCFYEIEGKRITEKDGDFSAMIGANPSAEGGPEDGLQGSEKTGINIVIAHKLERTYFTKKQFVTYIKDYMKKLIAKVEENDAERASILKPKLQAKVKDIATNFDSYEFYNGDELFSDSYKIDLKDDCYYEIEGKLITEKDGDYSAMIGANPSAEAEDDVQGSEKTDINIVIAHNLKKTGFTKKQFKAYIKDYMKTLIAKIEDNDPDKDSIFLKSKLNAKLKDILINFGSYEFYIGENMNPEGCTLLLNYREDGKTPFFTVFKASVVSEKY